MMKSKLIFLGSSLALLVVAAAVVELFITPASGANAVYASTPSVEVPSFIQVGKVYSLPDPNLQRITILQVDKGGWVQIKNLDGEILWLNMGAVKLIQEIPR